MAVNLPMELLRSFVAINDTGSMLQATERVFVTQSALSLQMRRLEEIVRRPLFNRQGRRLRLTEAGDHLLQTARQILAMNDQLVAALQGQALSGSVRIGMNQDFVEVFLSGVLSEFAITHPEIQMQVRVGGSQELLDLLKAGELDVVLCVRPEGEPKNIKIVPMAWFGHPHLLEREVLPLALLEAPCLFRAAALQSLELSGRPFRIVVETASLSGIRAAVQAGLAVTCRSQVFVDVSPIPVLAGACLPALPSNGYAVFSTSTPSAAVSHLEGLIRLAVANLD